jgi:hypothetical protein
LGHEHKQSLSTELIFSPVLRGRMHGVLAAERLPALTTQSKAPNFAQLTTHTIPGLLYLQASTGPVCSPAHILPWHIPQCSISTLCHLAATVTLQSRPDSHANTTTTTTITFSYTTQGVSHQTACGAGARHIPTAHSLSLVLQTPQPRQKLLPGSGCGTASTQREGPGHLCCRCSGWSWQRVHMKVVPQQCQLATWQQNLRHKQATAVCTRTFPAPVRQHHDSFTQACSTALAGNPSPGGDKAGW